jgi:hypothetical protein
MLGKHLRYHYAIDKFGTALNMPRNHIYKVAKKNEKKNEKRNSRKVYHRKIFEVLPHLVSFFTYSLYGV